MELKYINGYYITIQRNGNNVNGKPIYLLNFFDNKMSHSNSCIAQKTGKKLDKNNNIKIVSYNADNDIRYIFNQLQQLKLLN
jgi:hypothetical protein